MVIVSGPKPHRASGSSCANGELVKLPRLPKYTSVGDGVVGTHRCASRSIGVAPHVSTIRNCPAGKVGDKTKLTVVVWPPLTVAVSVPVMKPLAVAVIVTDPTATPVSR